MMHIIMRLMGWTGEASRSSKTMCEMDGLFTVGMSEMPGLTDMETKGFFTVVMCKEPGLADKETNGFITEVRSEMHGTIDNGEGFYRQGDAQDDRYHQDDLLRSRPRNGPRDHVPIGRQSQLPSASEFHGRR